MHRLSASFVLGYHGCDREIGERLLAGEPFRPSANDYDWLGPGIYFWEANPMRGFHFAIESQRRRRSSVIEPYVVGAVIDLGQCLDLTTMSGVILLKDAYRKLVELAKRDGGPLPRNSEDGLRRTLDCAVIIEAHDRLAVLGDPPVDSVRAAFTEGRPAYPSAGFFERTHVQIAVRNAACIKGVFRVPAEHVRSRVRTRRRRPRGHGPVRKVKASRAMSGGTV